MTENTRSTPEKLKSLNDRIEKETPSTQTRRSKRIALSDKLEVKSNTVVEPRVTRKFANARSKSPMGLLDSKDTTSVASPRRTRRVSATASQQGTPSRAIASSKLLHAAVKEQKQNYSPTNTADSEEAKGK